MDGCMHACMEMYGMHACMEMYVWKCMYVCMYVWSYIYIYIITHPIWVYHTVSRPNSAASIATSSLVLSWCLIVF